MQGLTRVGRVGIILAFQGGMRECVIRAPIEIGAQTRAVFRDEALRAMAELGETPGARLVVDLEETVRLDSAGLGTLVMLQLRAAERRHSVVLRNASEEVRFLLLMTKLEERFEIEPRR